MRVVNLRILVAVALLAVFLLISGFGDIGSPKVRAGTGSDPLPGSRVHTTGCRSVAEFHIPENRRPAGNVVLIYFWTFECWNCYRSFPWLNSQQHEYAAKGLRSQKDTHRRNTTASRDVCRVAEKVKEFELDHPGS